MKSVLAAAALLLGTAAPAVAATDFPVLQMNLCRSGIANCFNQGGTNPMAKAASTIVSVNPAVVTLNEACSSETTKLAADVKAQSGRAYTVVWQPVGKKENGRTTPYPCTSGRGEYGIAVLARQDLGAVKAREGGYYGPQDGGAEQRAYLCAKFGTVNACTTHLSTKRPAVEQQCRDLKGLLAKYGTGTVFGGDLNLRYPGDPSAQACVPAGSFRKGDGSVQHIIAGGAFGFGSSGKTSIPGTDHPAWRVALTR
ncbi:endonuclease/exonuclease/phosphatase family protein [Amycolatopsis sp. EV170708-02-1]|uniref:endonuclease/exonuclease/phosphatase family protein n=1 Tax=Amycolatopsis sp. EV170708-02-1 TaxID=2919322 RepID=UPI001F0BD692|nr:endonuclease/exonuclease/phosphatase family protein [Amycolatopsis sp. EV170708-02-1]UMP03217.1 endonuclease/exonuclease/phosphatase family protein [Amycolatopsis sp. EV170708-02-1]